MRMTDDTRSLPPAAKRGEQRGGCHGGVQVDGPPVGTCGGHGVVVPTPEDVIGYDALWESAMLCMRGVRWKGSVASFELNMSEQVGKLCDQLHDGTYRPMAPTCFKVHSPKERDIVGIRFRDRVYQRSLNDNCVYPMMSPSWIYDNCACQEGKGTDFARGRLVAHVEREMRSSGAVPHVLMADVKGYYPNMRHDVTEDVFQRYLPDWAFERVRDILRQQYPGDVGYNPGSQLVQIAGVSVLSELDHVLKEGMHAKRYVRYMDDMRIVSHDVGFLLDIMDCIAGYLRDIGFELNARKTLIRPLRRAVPFCGFDFVVRNRRVLMFLHGDSVRRMRRRVGRLARLEARGERPPGTAEQSYLGWRAHAAKGCSTRLLDNNDRWFTELEGKFAC